MKNYDRINALPPKGIAQQAHIVGGGIVGLATAGGNRKSQELHGWAHRTTC